MAISTKMLCGNMQLWHHQPEAGLLHQLLERINFLAAYVHAVTNAVDLVLVVVPCLSSVSCRPFR